MNLRPRRRDDPDVSLTPLIDVVFLLLIFFMVSTTFDRQSQLELQLPEASAEPTEIPEQVIEIAVTREGRYYVNDREVLNTESATLQRALGQVLGEADPADMPVIIRADGQAPHQAVVTALDAAGRLGLVHVSLATLQASDSDGE